MALRICIECGKEYSDTVKKCPHCGYKQKKINDHDGTTHPLNKHKKIKLFLIIAIVIIVILGIFAGIEINNSQKINRLENKADLLYEQGKFEEAFVIYNEILKIKESPEIYVKKLKCETELESILIKSLINSAEGEFAEGNYNESIAIYNEAQLIKYSEIIKSEINDIQNIKNLIIEAEEYYKKNEFENAIKAYNDILLIKTIPEIKSKIDECELAIDSIYICDYLFIQAALAVSADSSRKITAHIAAVWRNTVYHKYDKYNNGNYDLNIALSNLYSADEINKSAQSLMKLKEEIDLQMKKLQNPPTDFKFLYSEFLILYEKYCNLYNQALLPYSGSFTMYTADFISNTTEYDEQVERILLLIPELDSFETVDKYGINMSNSSIYKYTEIEKENLIELEKMVLEFLGN